MHFLSSLLPFKPSHQTQGILWGVWAGLLSAVMIAMVRHASATIDPALMVFFRNGFAALLFLPYIIRYPQFLRTTHMPLHILRAIAGIIAMILWFYALTLLPSTEAVALNFTLPLFATLAAVIFLKETVGIYRWIALCIGFAGVLIILQPGVMKIQTGAVLVLIASMFMAMAGVFTRMLTQTDSPKLVVFYFAFYGMLASAIPAAMRFSMPSFYEFLWLIAIALVATLMQIAHSICLERVAISIYAPFDFCRLIFMSLIAYLAFGEIISYHTVLGSMVIVSAAVYITYREARKRRNDSRDARSRSVQEQ